MARPVLEARGYRVFEVSALTHEGLTDLGFALAAMVDQARKDAPPLETARLILRPKAVDDSGFTVTRVDTPDGAAFQVRGVKPERWVHQTDFANDEAVGYLAERLATIGVEEKLFHVGATPGATVIIGDRETGVIFDWEPTFVAGAELLGARGSDALVASHEGQTRLSRAERRTEHLEQMDAKAAAREELRTERGAGHWLTPDDETAVKGEEGGS
jgi:GTPase